MQLIGNWKCKQRLNRPSTRDKQLFGVISQTIAKCLVFYFLVLCFSCFVRFGYKNLFLLAHQNKKNVVATSNNITNNQAPVPSVCVRVPHSPSNSSGENSTPGSPVEKAHHDFATLVVREFVNPKKSKTNKTFSFIVRAFCLVCMLLSPLADAAQSTAAVPPLWSF